MKSRINIIAISLAVIVLAILAGSMILNYISAEKVSPNILFLTQPVYSLTGKVTSVSNNSFTVTINMIKPVETATSSKAGSRNKTATYTIKTDAKTVFTRQELPLDYEQKTKRAFRTAPPGLKNVQKDDMVTIITSADLRTLMNNTIIASTITLPSVQKLISGTITNVSGDMVQLSSSPSFPVINGVTDFSQTKITGKTYDIYISSNSHLMKNTFSGGMNPTFATKEVGIDALRKGMELSVYLENDVSVKPMKMLYAEFSEYTTPSPTAAPTTNSLIPQQKLTPIIISSPSSSLGTKP